MSYDFLTLLGIAMWITEIILILWLIHQSWESRKQKAFHDLEERDRLAREEEERVRQVLESRERQAREAEEQFSGAGGFDLLEQQPRR